ELVVAEELVEPAVEAVGSRLGQQIDDSAARPAHLGGVCIGVDLYFSDHVNRGADQDGELLPFVVVHAIDQLFVKRFVLTVCDDVGRLAPLVGPGAAQDRVGRPGGDADGALNQGYEIAAVQGQVLDGLRGEDCGEGGRVALQSGTLGLNLHGLRHIA